MNLINPKEEIFTLLATITNSIVRQERQKIIELIDNKTVVTFRITENKAEYTLDKDIGRQVIVVTIDFWAKTSLQNTLALIQAEGILRNSNYLMQDAFDIPNDEGYSHLSSRFVY